MDCKHRQRHCERGGSEEEPTNHHLLLLARRSMGKCHKHSSNLSKNETNLQLAMSRIKEPTLNDSEIDNDNNNKDES